MVRGLTLLSPVLVSGALPPPALQTPPLSQVAPAQSGRWFPKGDGDSCPTCWCLGRKLSLGEDKRRDPERPKKHDDVADETSRGDACSREGIGQLMPTVAR